MENLSSIVLVAEIVLFAALTVLAMYLIFAMKKIANSVQSIEKNVNDLQVRTQPVIENVTEVSGNIKAITGEVKKQMDKVNDIVDSVKSTTDSIIEFEQKAQKQIEGPVFDSLNFISSLYNGIRTFVTKMSDSTNNRRRKRVESETEEFDERGN